MKSAQIRSFFWSVFSHIRTKYGDLLRKSLYSVRIQKNVELKTLSIWTLFTQWRRWLRINRLASCALEYLIVEVSQVRTRLTFSRQ